MLVALAVLSSLLGGSAKPKEALLPSVGSAVHPYMPKLDTTNQLVLDVFA